MHVSQHWSGAAASHAYLRASLAASTPCSSTGPSWSSCFNMMPSLLQSKLLPRWPCVGVPSVPKALVPPRRTPAPADPGRLVLSRIPAFAGPAEPGRLPRRRDGVRERTDALPAEPTLRRLAALVGRDLESRLRRERTLLRRRSNVARRSVARARFAASTGVSALGASDSTKTPPSSATGRSTNIRRMAARCSDPLPNTRTLRL